MVEPFRPGEDVTYRAFALLAADVAASPVTPATRLGHAPSSAQEIMDYYTALAQKSAQGVPKP